MSDRAPDDHTELLEAEEDELPMEERREEKAVERTDEAHKEYEEETK